MFSRRQLGYLGLLVAIGLFLAVLNPFDSVTELPLPAAIGYWVSLIVYGGITGELIAWAIRRLLPRLPVGGYIAILSVLMTATVYPAVWLAQVYVTRAPIQLEDAPRFVLYILMISGAVVSVIVFGFRAMGRRSAILDPYPGDATPPPPPPASVPASFLDRLPVKFRTGELYAVSAEDHYLRVHTSLGEALILMRLGDAMKEVGALEGLQTHRSWWVAKQGLADVTRGNGKLVLKLKSGAEAPVSRTYAAAVKEKGWT